MSANHLRNAPHRTRRQQRRARRARQARRVLWVSVAVVVAATVLAAVQTAANQWPHVTFAVSAVAFIVAVGGLAWSLTGGGGQ